MTAAPADQPVVLVPAGAPILDAARWVGHACWAELRFHEVLTGWLALEADAELTLTFWAVRAHRAELAEAFHHRLPELREFPRAGFVRASAEADAGFAGLEALTDPSAGAARADALAAALARMVDHYRAHAAVAVGPADAPTAASVADAVRVTEADVARLGGGSV